MASAYFFQARAQHPVDRDLLGKHGGRGTHKPCSPYRARYTVMGSAFRCAGQCHHLVQVAFVVPVQTRGCGGKEEGFRSWLGWKVIAAAADTAVPLKIKREVRPWNGQILCIWCAPAEQDSAENSSAYRRSVAAFAALGYAWRWAAPSSHWRWWPGRCRSCCRAFSFRLGVAAAGSG